MIIDKDQARVKSIRDKLSAANFRVVSADTGQKIVEHVLDKKPDLLLLNDEIIKKSSLKEFCSRFKSDPDLRLIPVIFISSRKNIKRLEIISGELMHHHIFDPFDLEELQGKIELCLKIKTFQEEVDSKNRILAEDLLLTSDLAEFGHQIHSLNLNSIIKSVKERVPSLTNAKHFLLYTYNEDEDSLKIMAHNYKRLDKKKRMMTHASRDRVIGMLLKDKNKIQRDKGLLILPLFAEGRLWGVLYLKEPKKGRFHKEDIKMATLISTQLAYALRNLQMYKRMENLSITDELTGLYNYRYFQERLSEELKRVKRSFRPFSLILIDIDHFKKVNDTCGHKKGDRVLKKIADIIRFGLRDFDIAARYGGEEFVLLLPDTALKESIAIAERTRKNIGGYDFSKENIPFSITISIGVTAYHPGDKKDQDQLFEEADRFLYRAKKRGRNRICYPKPVSRKPKIKTEVTKEEKKELF